MNNYEAKQEARRERYEARAAQARKESEETFDRAKSMADAIPFGQPILVGHHSEKRDRNYRARITNTFEKSFALSDKAKHYEQKAASIGKGGISSDDPDAIEKLEEKLAKLEQKQAHMKAVNAAHKKYLKEPASLDKCDFSESTKQLIRDYIPQYSWEPHPFPPYALQNNNANIRRIKQRIEDLKKAQEIEPKEHKFDDFEVIEDDNRIQFIFPGKPAVEVRAILKRHAFKWSPSRGAWVRFLNGSGRFAAQCVIEELKKIGLA